MKKTTVFAKLLACAMTAVFCAWGGVIACADGSEKDNEPQATSYTVTFNTDGGSEVASQTVEAGKTATKPTDPTKENAPFLNWLKDGKPFNFSTPITADITLTAEWGTPGATVFKITFNSDGGTAIDPQNVESGKTATEPSAPEKEGFTFLGWYNGDTAFDFTKPITENITLTANWKPATTNPSDEEGDKKPNEPVISGPVAGGVKDLQASNEELETAYITWKAADNAAWYNVYVSPANADNWVKLDGPLVRQYADYFRADALGLKAGTYDMKVVPVSGEDTEATEYASKVTNITVKAHERTGYGFYGASASGAYNDDGTLKKDAVILYITAETAKTVKATVTKGKNTAEYTGFQAILKARENSKDETPLCFRIVGKVSDKNIDYFESKEEGLQVKGTENITIEGVGNDGTMFGFGILIRACKNVEIRNLGILYFMDDGISIDTDNSHLWVHNNDIFYGQAGSASDQVKGDGSLDTKGSSLITHSYNHFWDSGKCNLQGMKSEAKDTRITYHHNWYDHSDSRHPRIRTATVHTYNNYFDGNAKYGVGVTMGASAFVENNYFRSTAAMRPMMSSMQGTDATGEKGTFSSEAGGMIKAYGNIYDCSSSNLKLMTQKDTSADNIDCYEASSREEKVPATYTTKNGGTTYNNFDTDSDFYKYTPDSAENAKKNVERYAGRVGGGDLKWEFNNATEDSNSSIISGLKAAVTGYTASVVKIGGGTASTTPGDSTGGGDDGDGDNQGGNENGGSNTPSTTGSAVISFSKNGVASDDRVTGASNKEYKPAETYDDKSYSYGAKLNSTGSFTLTLEKEYAVTFVLGTDKNGYTQGLKINDVAYTATGNLVKATLNAGAHTVTNGGSETSVFLIILE